jgi:hypothetical protein
MSKELCYATLLWELGTSGFFHILHVPSWMPVGPSGQSFGYIKPSFVEHVGDLQTRQRRFRPAPPEFFSLRLVN